MLIDLDHDDFPKAKKALVTASLFTTLAFRITIEKNQIAFLGLKLDVTTFLLKLLAVPTFLYFGVVFVLLFFSRRTERVLELESARQEFSKINDDPLKTDREKSDAFRRFALRRNKQRTMTLVDLTLPLVVSAITFYVMYNSVGVTK